MIYTAYFKATITARNYITASKKAQNHIKTKYQNTMKCTFIIDQEE